MDPPEGVQTLVRIGVLAYRYSLGLNPPADFLQTYKGTDHRRWT